MAVLRGISGRVWCLLEGTLNLMSTTPLTVYTGRQSRHVAVTLTTIMEACELVNEEHRSNTVPQIFPQFDPGFRVLFLREARGKRECLWPKPLTNQHVDGAAAQD